MTPVKPQLGPSSQKGASDQHLAEESEDSTFPSDCSKSENEDNAKNEIISIGSPSSATNTNGLKAADHCFEALASSKSLEYTSNNNL